MSSCLQRLLRRVAAGLMVAALAWLASIPAMPAADATGQPASSAPGPYVAGEVIIGWQSEPHLAVQGASLQLAPDRTSATWRAAVGFLAAGTGLAVLDAQPEYGLARLATLPGQELAEVARLASLPWITYAELNYVASAAAPDTWVDAASASAVSHVQAPALVPNDPRFSEQWNMLRINAPGAWDLTRGSSSFVVAIIDSGIDLIHPEFAGRLLPGYDYVNGDNEPNDDNGHGTHVAGILAAALNNGIGVAGVAPSVRILPLKVLGASGTGSYYDIATAIRRAADNAAQVINLSLGGVSESQTLHEAVIYAASRNALVVAAAGNCAQGGTGCGSLINPNFYPAAYPEAFAVGATDRYDNWATYSGYRSYVALSAPGGTGWSQADQVLSTVPGGYGYRYATSMATAAASGVAALAWTFMPSASRTEIADVLKITADKVGLYPYVDGRNDFYGHGRLNAAAAVRYAYPPALDPITQTQRIVAGNPILQRSVPVWLTNASERAVAWQAAVVLGGDWLSLAANSGESRFSAPGRLELQVDARGLALGFYDGVVEVRPTAPSASSFRFPVLLQVTDKLHVRYVPLTAK